MSSTNTLSEGFGNEKNLAESPSKPFENRRRVREDKRRAVLRVAVQLFLEQGFDRTSLNEVAERLNITKPALYNYFPNKEDILIECYRLGQDMAMKRVNTVCEGEGDGLTRLKRLIYGYSEVMTLDFGQCLVRVDDRVLSTESRAQVRNGKRAIDRGFRDCIEAGIADGSIRACDVRVTSFAIAGAINWIGHWFQPDGALSAHDVCSMYAENLTAGICRHSPSLLP